MVLSVVVDCYHSIMKCVSTRWYVLVYSYLDFRTSRLQVTRTESTLMGMLINLYHEALI